MMDEHIRTKFWKKTLGLVVVWYSKWDDRTWHFNIEIPHVHLHIMKSR